MLTITSIALGGIFILLAVLLAWSYPGKPKPFVDQNGHPLAGSISEKIYLNINGVEQGMFIKGKDVNNPVLLYLHGGRLRARARGVTANRRFMAVAGFRAHVGEAGGGI